MKINKQAYSEVYAVINLMSSDLIRRIPDNILKNIDKKRDKNNHIEIYDINEYEFLDDSNKLLAVIYKNYFATDEEKKIIQAKENSMRKKARKSE